MFTAPGLLKLAELVVNEFIRRISKTIYQYFFFYPIYHCLMYFFPELITKLITEYSLLLIMNYQCLNFG